jgi:hypothetical protein
MSSKIADVIEEVEGSVPAAPAVAANLMPLAAAPARAGAAAEAVAAAAQAAVDAALADDEGWEDGAMTPEELVPDLCGDVFERLDAALRAVPDPVEEQRNRMLRREELERLIPLKKEWIFGSMWHEFNAHSWVYARITGRVFPNWMYDELADLILELERLR